MAKKDNQSKRKLPDPPIIRALQAQKSEEKTPYEFVLDGLPYKDQVKLVRSVEQLGIKKNDPMFFGFGNYDRSQVFT